MNLSFVLPALHLNILKTEKMLSNLRQKILDVRGTVVIPAQEVKDRNGIFSNRKNTTRNFKFVN